MGEAKLKLDFPPRELAEQVKKPALLFSGKLMHQRLSPVGHGFTYPACFFAFDLDQLEKTDSLSSLFAYNRRSLLSIRDQDYLGDEVEGSIKEKALLAVPDKELREQVHRVVLITSPRFLGYVFNPVSFYYFYDAAGVTLGYLAEVNNTFSEKHIYFVKAEVEQKSKKLDFCSHKKEFYVSPFFKPEGQYRFYFSPLSDSVEIRVDLVQNGQMVFTSSLKGEAQDFSKDSVRKSFLKFPVMSSFNFPRILIQAGYLYFKKNLPVFSKPAPFHDNTRQYKPSVPQKLSRNLFDRILARIEIGQFSLVYPEGSKATFGSSKEKFYGELRVRDNQFFTKVLTGGDIGFGEAVAEGFVESTDMVSFLRLAIRNQELMKGDTTVSGPKKVLGKIGHALRANSVKGSKKNISAHYDLSNEFFKLFLDFSMTYSSAVFGAENSSLEEAQSLKIDKALARIDLDGDLGKECRVLEIGSGWGSVARKVLARKNTDYLGITLSEQQLSYCLQELSGFISDKRARFELLDYRKVSEKFDRIVSVEMIEAVGKDYLQTYFQCLDELLVPTGKAVIQAITIADDRYADYCEGCDWIQKYIFPGGHLPCPQVIDELVAGTGLKVAERESIGLHYARTLAEWRERFDSKLDEVLALGFDEKFIRMWRYYFDYCEAGFREKAIDCYQISLEKI